MCTYHSQQLSIDGAAKGADGWIRVSDAQVYFDHPSHLRAEHALAIDFFNPSLGPSARVAVELDASTARDLAQAILSTLDTVPASLLGAE